MRREVLLVDVGVGNLRSVEKALASLGATVKRAADPQQVAQAERIVLPGVGAFGAFMEALRAAGLDEALLKAQRRGAFLLGICLGMQVLLEVGEEMGEHHGLGLIPGRVVRFPSEAGIRIPHTGWNQVHQERPSPLLAGVAEDGYFYFNHSYYCQVSDPAWVWGTSEYGIAFPSVIGGGSLWGVQFHPEKSQRLGLKLLKNFLELR